MTLTREELALRCASTSFDRMNMDYETKKIVYTHSFRDGQGSVLEEFKTEIHFSELQPRPLTPPEEHALRAFGLCHSTYVYLVAAKRAPLLQIRAGYFSPAELAFFRGALAGALAEYFYLADLDLANFSLECCCDPPQPQAAESQAAPVAGEATATTTATVTTAAPVAAGQCTEPTPAPAPVLAVGQVSAPAGHQPPELPPDAAGAVTADTCSGGGRPRVLVPFGGGKDSTLLMELLSSMGAQVGWIYYGEWVGSWEVYGKFARLAAASPAANVVLVEQALPHLDRLKELNLAPELPFQDYSAYVSFYTFASAFVALQQGYDYICVGNEYSANAINTTHPKYKYPVNHQYEKSFAAERAFHAYLRDHLSRRLYYFSGLQHMTELEIAQRFAAVCVAKYLDLIISCNWAVDDDWCGGCEKCAFVFLLFAAFLPVPDIMAKVFGVTAPTAAAAGNCNGHGVKKDTSSPIVPGSRESLRGVYDMYDSERHVPVFESLMGLAGHKPFECVGTPEECLAAMYLAYERYSGENCQRDLGSAAAAAAVASGGGSAAVREESTAAGPGPDEPSSQQQSGDDQRRHDGDKRLPLLLRKHVGLITSKGREEWEKIRESMRRVAETGRASVPTLYPDWFKLGGGGLGE